MAFVLGGAAGTPIGVWMLHYVDPTVFKLAVGLIQVASGHVVHRRLRASRSAVAWPTAACT